MARPYAETFVMEKSSGKTFLSNSVEHFMVHCTEVARGLPDLPAAPHVSPKLFFVKSLYNRVAYEKHKVKLFKSVFYRLKDHLEDAPVIGRLFGRFFDIVLLPVRVKRLSQEVERQRIKISEMDQLKGQVADLYRRLSEQSSRR